MFIWSHDIVVHAWYHSCVYYVCPCRSRAVVEEKEREVREVGEKVEALQRSVSQLRQQISVAEERIPRLEESKKTAVAGTVQYSTLQSL